MPLQGAYGPSTSEWARKQAEAYERSGGVEAPTLRGKPVIVLTTVGAKSGLLRKTALMRVEHAGAYAVVGSDGGAPVDPAWCRNLRANPLVELQDGDERHDYLAREVAGAERDAWWARACEEWPDYATYQTRTTRPIPVFVLERAAADRETPSDESAAHAARDAVVGDSRAAPSAG